jgi:DMSO reductase family type II enzyme molybdopterin subunit
MPTTEDAYRAKWRWDKVTWSTHCVNCSPGNCPVRVYTKDGVVLREEQAGTYDTIEAGVPDMNPMGCQKGAAWSHMQDASERVLHPLKRDGERGQGRWLRVSWDEALTDVADAVIDAIHEDGPQSILDFTNANEGGALATFPFARLIGLLGGVSTDVNADIGDFNVGLFETFGQAASSASVDDWFHSRLTLIWHRNPVYTAIPHYHYIAEGRYNGAQVVTIAPDVSPSTIHADYHVPVRPGSDAALALAMCHVIVNEGLHDARFVREQTDLPLLVRSDTGRFLRETDVKGEGKDDQFYFLDAGSGEAVEAPRGTLELEDREPVLEGRFQVALADGTKVEVAPVFQILKDSLAEYEPEKAAVICGSNPEVIRRLARMVAGNRTSVLLGFNSAKYYHGDLMERSISLLLALTGNWGRKGTGIGNPIAGMFDGSFLFPRKTQTGPAETAKVLGMRSAFVNALKAQDDTLTDEIAGINLMAQGAVGDAGGPSALLWYHHTGHRDNWNRQEWGDPDMSRPFDDYVREAGEKGWWSGLDRPPVGTTPRVAFIVGGNVLRRNRGGRTLLLEHLWPKLRMVVSMDCKMTATGLFSDIVLPVASNYEKVSFGHPTQWMLQLTLSDQAVPPAGEAKPEWEIYLLLAKKLEERAKARGLGEYTDRLGARHKMEGLYDALSASGQWEDAESVAREMVADTTASGTLPEGTTLDTLRERGFVRFTGWGISPFDAAQATDIKADETHAPLSHHVERRQPYPTLTRRAQFYIDHEWFLEAGEELPVHKENPKMGGDYPLVMTSGHNRWSVHSVNITNSVMLNTHRGRPHLVIGDGDAAARGVSDGDAVRVFNDVGAFTVPAKVASGVRPGQVIIYNGWDPVQFPDWKGPMDLEPGMVKWLHFAGGYGHLRYWITQWQPVPIDRGIAVDVRGEYRRKAGS